MFLNNLLNIFHLHHACTHDKIRPDLEFGYCPDCGKLIKNEWYLTRCSCCGVKLKTIYKNGEIIPQNHYCSNCGNESFTIEKINKINFIDINFAVLVRREAHENEQLASTTQCWHEKINEQPKLITQYL